MSDQVVICIVRFTYLRSSGRGAALVHESACIRGDSRKTRPVRMGARGCLAWKFGSHIGNRSCQLSALGTFASEGSNLASIPRVIMHILVIAFLITGFSSLSISCPNPSAKSLRSIAAKFSNLPVYANSYARLAAAPVVSS
jgi:hypothetical protein